MCRHGHDGHRVLNWSFWSRRGASAESAIEAQVPDRKIVHVILDNYAAHKHPKVRQWLDRHPRFTFHFTPTSCSWLNECQRTEYRSVATQLPTRCLASYRFGDYDTGYRLGKMACDLTRGLNDGRWA